MMTRTLLLLLPFITCIWCREICCPDLGCFTNDGDFKAMPLPDCQSNLGITHMLFTRNNRGDGGELITRQHIPSEWNGDVETVLLIHGYNNNKDTPWLHKAMNYILDTDDKNVIIVGWGDGANMLNYLQCASNTRVVGAETRDIIDILRAQHERPIATYCAGHSLGAHACGHVGQFRSDKGLDRISGLDPAGPAFADAGDRRGLNINCAEQVEAWHTDGKDAVNSYGTLKPMGHRDFYPNGGDMQPGCATKLSPVLMKMGIRSDPLVACSHSRATKYFIESVKSDCFRVREICTDENDLPGSCSPCPDGCPTMGYVNGGSVNGKFYLETKRMSPHCHG